MLPGAVDLFRGRAFIGRAAVKAVCAAGEPLDFSLGVQNQLQVDRFVKREKLEGASTFGSSKKLRRVLRPEARLVTMVKVLPTRLMLMKEQFESYMLKAKLKTKRLANQKGNWKQNSQY